MSEGKTIQFECDVRDHAVLDHLIPLQGELKSLSRESYLKIRKEITETGFAFPVHVWASPDDKLYVIGGHQRLRVLKELRDAEGFTVGPVPIIKVKADTIEMAKRRILQDASSYGRVERQGLYELMSEFNLDPGDLASSFELPNIDLPSFNAEFFFDDVTGDSPGSSAAPADGALIDSHPPAAGEAKRPKTGSTEYNADQFANFAHKCPRCGFSFD